MILLNKSCSAAHTYSSLAFGQEANMSDSNDQEGHELTFDEWKLANIEIASALKLPSKDVEENSRFRRGVKRGGGREIRCMRVLMLYAVHCPLTKNC
jgi:hypothetical protein